MRQVLNFFAVTALFIQVNQISAVNEELEKLNKLKAAGGNISSVVRLEQSDEFDNNERARKELDKVGRDAVRTKVFEARDYLPTPNQQEILRKNQQAK